MVHPSLKYILISNVTTHAHRGTEELRITSKKLISNKVLTNILLTKTLLTLKIITTFTFNIK